MTQPDQATWDAGYAAARQEATAAVQLVLPSDPSQERYQRLALTAIHALVGAPDGRIQERKAKTLQAAKERYDSLKSRVQQLVSPEGRLATEQARSSTPVPHWADGEREPGSDDE